MIYLTYWERSNHLKTKAIKRLKTRVMIRLKQFKYYNHEHAVVIDEKGMMWIDPGGLG